MDRDDRAWAGLAALTLIWSVTSLGSGGTALIPLLLSAIAAACAVHRPSRARVMEWISRRPAGAALRSGLILIGALMLVQMLPFELALLMAGDVLTYLEAATVVGLIAGQTRLRPAFAVALRPVASALLRLPRPIRAAARRLRLARTARRWSSPTDGDAPAWAAFA